MIAALERTFALRAFGGQFEDVIPHMTLVDSPDLALWARTESRVGESLPLSETISTFSIYRETHSGWPKPSRSRLGDHRMTWGHRPAAVGWRFVTSTTLAPRVLLSD
jgi:hypothetical protein